MSYYSSYSSYLNTRLCCKDPVGPQGATGPQGVTGPQGPQGVTGPVGGITSVNSGTNINVDNTNPLAPIVNFATPTTSNILLGVGTEIQAKDNYATPLYTMSIDSTGFNNTFLNGLVENKQDIAVSSTNVVQTISATDGSTYQNSAIVNCGTSNISDQKLATNLTTTQEGSAGITCGSTLVSMGVGCGFPSGAAGSVGLQATDTNPLIALSQSAPFQPSYSTILDKNGINQNNSSGIGFNLQTAQDLTLTCPVANKIIVPNGNDIDLSSTTGSVVHTTTYGKDGMESQDFLAANYSSQAQLTQTGGNSQMTLSSANLATFASHILQTEVPLVGDATIAHTTPSGASRNLVISSQGNLNLNSTASAGMAGQGVIIQASNQPLQLTSPASNIQYSSSSGQQVLVSSVNSVSAPTYTITNTNASTASYPAVKIDRTNPASVAGDTIGTISMWADDGAGTSREWSRIQTQTTNTGAGNQDGTISIFGSINGVVSEVFNFNGNQNENNSFKPLDMNNQQIRSNTGNLELNTTASTGTGSIILTAKNPTGEIQLVAPNYVNVSSAIKVGVSPSYNFIQNDAIDIFDTTTATANTTATLGREGVGFTRLNTLTSLSQSFSFYNDSASGGVIDYQNTIGTNGMILTTNQSIELNTTTLNLANTNTTASASNHNADIRATSTGLESTTFLKLQLNGVDIWVPYFTTDPSI